MYRSIGRGRSRSDASMSRIEPARVSGPSRASANGARFPDSPTQRRGQIRRSNVPPRQLRIIRVTSSLRCTTDSYCKGQACPVCVREASEIGRLGGTRAPEARRRRIILNDLYRTVQPLRREPEPLQASEELDPANAERGCRGLVALSLR